MAYRLRPDTFYVRKGDGVWLRNNFGSFEIHGRSAYRIVDTICRQLDGGGRLADVYDGLSDEGRTAVGRIVEALDENRFIAQVTSPPEVVPDDIRELYAEHLASLEYWVDDPLARFRSIRSSPIACIGDGPTFTSLIGALIDLGFSHVQAVTSSSHRSVVGVVSQARSRDTELTNWNVVTAEGEPYTTTLERPEVRAARALLFAPAGGLGSGTAEVELTARRRGQVVGVVGAMGAHAVATPIGRQADDWCWGCHLLALGAAQPNPSGNGEIPPAPSMIVAFQLAHRLFCHLAGTPVVEDQNLTTVDLFAPTIRSHLPRRHPLCPHHRSPAAGRPGNEIDVDDRVRPDVPDPLDPLDLSDVHDRITEHVTEWTDPVVGPLLQVSEADNDQIPLASSTCLARVAAPDGELEHGELVCKALAARESRNQVVLTGLEWLVERVGRRIDDRRQITAFGAGWTYPEACFRAWANAAVGRREGRGPTAWSPFPPDDTEVRGFLRDLLVDRGDPCESVQVEGDRFGVVRATVRHLSGRLSIGVGLDAGDAIDHALLRAVASTLSADASCAFMSPPVRTWNEAIGIVDDRRKSASRIVDVGHFLPFIDGRAAVVAVVAGRGR